MDILGTKAVGDSVVKAAQEVHATVDDALHTVDTETIPAAEQAARAIVNQAIYGVAGVIADLANRLNGAECPIDITATVSARITGKIGALRINNPEQMPAQSVEVRG